MVQRPGQETEGAPRPHAPLVQPPAPPRGSRPQPRCRGGVSRDEPAPFIQEVKATSGSMKTNGEPGQKEGGRGGGSSGAREGAAGQRKRERKAGRGYASVAAACAARPGDV